MAAALAAPPRRAGGPGARRCAGRPSRRSPVGWPPAPPGSPHRRAARGRSRPARSQTASSSSTVDARCGRRRRGARRRAPRGPWSSAAAAVSCHTPPRSTSTPRSRAPRTSSVNTWRLPPDRRASSASAGELTGRSRARWSSAPSSSGSNGSRSRRSRCPSRWRRLNWLDGAPPGAHGADDEHAPGDDERDDDGEGRVVEQIEIVDDEDQPVVPRQTSQGGTGAVEQRRALVLADAEILDERARQEVGEGAERDRSRRRVTDRPGHPPTGALGREGSLLGKPGLADAGRTLQHDAAALTRPVQPAEVLELGRPPGQRPRGDHHSAPCRIASRGSRKARTSN